MTSKIVGMNQGGSGTHKMRTGTVMGWGENGYPRTSTEEFRDGYDIAFEGKDQERQERQQARADEFKAWKESMKTQ